MKKTIARALLCVMMLSCFMVVPTNALQADYSDYVYTEATWDHITVKGGKNMGYGNVCKKTLSGNAQLSAITTSSTSRQPMKGDIKFHRTDLGTSVEVANVFTISSTNTPATKTVAYTNNRGVVDKNFYVTLTTREDSSSTYTLTFNAYYQP